MTWDHQFNFAQPLGAQPPTPGQTPTASEFPETPKFTTTAPDRSGWTPNFAEEYTVFASTPGRITSGPRHSFTEAATPQTATTYAVPAQPRCLAVGGNIEASIASHVHILADQGTPLLPVATSKQLPSSPNPDAHAAGGVASLDVSRRRINPPPRKQLDAAFSGQTATPPKTASKGSRCLAPQMPGEGMQALHADQVDAANTPTQPSAMTFAHTSSDMFGYPVSAPATAPIFTNTKTFWEPDTSMTGMGIDFAVDGHVHSPPFNQEPAKIAAAFDWTRQAQVFTDHTNNTHAGAHVSELGQNNENTGPTQFDFGTGLGSDPFTTPAGILHPGLLCGAGEIMEGITEKRDTDQSDPFTSHTAVGSFPGSRDSRKDLDERRRLQDIRNVRLNRPNRRIASSPVRPMHRVVGGSGGRRDTGSFSGRSSPLKQSAVLRLSSISETPRPNARTEVHLTIDAKGRARTETVLVQAKRTMIGSASALMVDDGDSSPGETTSDEEDIFVPSRNTSFTLPRPPRLPSMHAQDSTLPRSSSRRRSTGGSYSHSESSNSTRVAGEDSEAETVLGQDDSGDATHELRKMMEDRARLRRHPHPNHLGSSSRNFTSPGTLSERSRDTPTRSTSGTTRCICQSSHQGIYMIQCESCDYWLHTQCVGIDAQSLPPVYICAFCADTPQARSIRMRETMRGKTRIPPSPLAHKSFYKPSYR